MRSMHSWPMLGKKRHAFVEIGPHVSSDSFCKDFEAARKKALAVGAKKFFLEVGQVYNAIERDLNGF